MDQIKAENEKIEHRCDNLEMTKKQKDSDRKDLENEIASKVQAEKEKLRPMIKLAQDKKEQLRQDLERDEKIHDTELARIAELKERLE